MANIFKAKTLVGRTGIFSHEIIAPNLVYNTGYQNIDGLKDFTIRPTVGTIPVLLSGEVSTTISGVLYSAQINIKNNNGSTIYKGQPVYVSSAAGTNILVKLASNSGEQTSSKTLGLVYQTSLAQNAQGTIVTEGLLEGFNTNAGEEGDPIWLGPTGSLIFGLANKPYAPNHLVYLGVLTRKHANQGEVFVKIQNGFELEELHNVNINHRNTLADKNIIRYDSLSGIWFNDTINSVLPNSIVYTTGDQTISGIKTFNVFPIVSGNKLITGVDLNAYATVANLFATGSNLDNKINSLSGVSVLTFGDQNIYGNKNFSNNLVVSGSAVFNTIDLNNVDNLSISGVDVLITNGNINLTNRPTVNGTGIVLSGELEGMIINSGSLLNNKINSLSGSAVLTYGNQNVYGIKNFYGGIVVTGDGSTNGGYSLVAKNSAGINGLQFNPAQEGGAGNLYFNAGTTSRLYNVGDSTLEFYINSNQYRVANSFIIGNGSDIPDHTVSVINRYGYFGIGSGFSNPLERFHVSGGNLRVDGKILLSGNPVLTGVDLSSYATKSEINSLSGQVVFTTGNQIISGIKTFVDNTVFGDPSQGDFLVISGNTFTIYGSGNFTNGLFVSGVPVLTGSTNWYATSVNLASTGLILDNKINSLSGVSVLTFGNQTINGIKTFVSTGVFGASNINYTPLLSNPLSVVGSGNTFVQLNIQNFAIGNAASSDLVLTSNAGTDDSFYIDLGINNSGYNQAAYDIGSSGDGYLYVHGGNLTIGTQSPNRIIKFHTDGTTFQNQIAEINSTGYFSPNKAVIALSGFFGRNNSYIGADVTMGGGENNRISGDESVIAGGFGNRITGNLSNINGGFSNTIRGTKNTINGGENNQIGVRNLVDFGYITTTLYNFIGGGSGNNIPPHHCQNVIVGGRSNTIYTPILPFVTAHYNSILGGELNTVGGGGTCHTSILGGCCNCASSCGTTVVGGFCNGVFINNSTIAYGANNTGTSAGGNTVIFLGGLNNRIDSSSMSAVFGGCDNKIFGNCSSIIGGHSNTLGTCGSNRAAYASFIGGGGFNIITGTQAACSTTTEYSLIVGGYANKVTSCYGSILGGRQNLVSNVGATVIGDGGARDKISRGNCSLSLDFNGGIFLTGSNITLSPSPLPGIVDFCDSNLINATPNILNVNSNFSIGAGYNSRVVLANSGSMLTGTISLGNPTGFNSSVIQIGVGQVQITGAAGVIIQTYNNQFKTAGQYATISLLHSGNNGYIMYGNTA